MLKKIITFAIILAVFFGAGYYTAKLLIPDESDSQMGPVYASKEVTKGDIKVGVDITGQLQANYGGTISVPTVEGFSTPIKYKIEEYFVKENDSFKAGDPIVRLSSTNLSEVIQTEVEKVDDAREEIATHTKKINEYKEEIAIIISDLEDKLSIDITNINSIPTENGLLITAPIDGRITALSVKEGDKVTSNNLATIVNDAKLKIKFSTTVAEYSDVSVGDKVFLTFNGFEGYYEGEIVELNANKVPDASNTTFIHNGVIEAVNPGLVKPGIVVGVNTEVNGKAGKTLRNSGSVDSYLGQSNVNTNYTSTDSSPYFANEVFVSKNQFVKAGDPIVRIAGKGLTDDINEKVSRIKTKQEYIDTETKSVNSKNKDIAKIQERIAKLNSLRDQLTVVAEKDGIVSWMRYEPGDTLEATAGADRWSLSLCEVYNANEMNINTKVSDLDVIYIKEGSTVDVTVDALPGKHFEGTVDRLYQYQGGQNGAIQYSVNISVIGGEGLRPGMNTNCFVDAGESKDTLLIPIEAVFEEDYKQKVEVLKDDNTTEVAEIEIGLMNDRYVEVLSGLEEGQKVVTGSIQDLLPSEESDSKSGSLFPNN